MNAMWADLKHGARSLVKDPTFSAVAALTLALGVGFNALVFTVVNGVLLRPLPYEEPERLAVIEVNTGGAGWYGSSEPEVLDYQQLASFERVAAFDTSRWTLGGVAEPRRVRVAHATANLFPMLGVRPALGRTFAEDEDRPGAERVAVLAHGFWRSEYGGRDVLGESVVFEGTPHTIVGVMPRGFALPTPEYVAWTPLRIDRDDPWERNNHYLSVLGRLAPATGLESARSELATLAARLSAEHPDFYPETGYRARLVPLLDAVVGDVRASLLLLLGSVGFVLLIACTNVASLLLWRGDARRRELAVRSALGASRPRLVRQLLAEAFLLAALGAAVGLALAAAGGAVLLEQTSDLLPRLHEVTVDGRVLLFCLALVVATALAFGLYPAFHASRTDLRSSLRIAEGRASKSSVLVRRCLVVAQTSLAVVLLLGAGALTRSLVHLYRVDAGFATAGILTLELSVPVDPYEESPAIVDYYRAALARVRALPGVAGAGAVGRLPLDGGTSNLSIVIEGRPVANVGDAPAALAQWVTPGFFETLGVKLADGRLFDDRDRVGAVPAVIVSASMARAFWPGENAVGRRIRVFAGDHPWMEVVGVVGDVRLTGLDAEALPTWYVPHAQAYATAYYSPRTMTLAVRSASDLAALQRAVVPALRELDAAVPISNVRTMEDVVDLSLSTPRFTTLLMSLFSAAALVLAAVGVYGVLSVAVTRRRFEIGVRLALGAERRAILARVVGEGLALALAGIVLGLAGSRALSPLLESVLHGVAASDLAASAAAVAVLVAAAILASAVPAWRASRVDPARTLRSE